MAVYLILSLPPTALSSTFKKHDDIKRRAYGQHAREFEHASFTPIVLTATGGLAHEAAVFFKRLASFLSTKWGANFVLGLVLPELFVTSFCRPVYPRGTVFHWCLLQDSTTNGQWSPTYLRNFSCPAHAICAGGGRQGQSIQPGKKK